MSIYYFHEKSLSLYVKPLTLKLGMKFVMWLEEWGQINEIIYFWCHNPP